MRRSLFSALVLVGAIVSFAYGVAVGHYKFFPFNTLVELKQKIDEPISQQLTLPEQLSQQLTLPEQLMQYAFTREAPDNGLIYPPISSAEDIQEHNRSILTPRANYHHAYANISINR